MEKRIDIPTLTRPCISLLPPENRYIRRFLVRNANGSVEGETHRDDATEMSAPFHEHVESSGEDCEIRPSPSDQSGIERKKSLYDTGRRTRCVD